MRNIIIGIAIGLLIGISADTLAGNSAHFYQTFKPGGDVTIQKFQDGNVVCYVSTDGNLSVPQPLSCLIQK